MIGIGERLPNFVRLDHTGAPVMLYDLCCGEAAFMALARPGQAAEALSALAALSPDTPSIRRLLLLAGGAATVEPVPCDITMLIDSDGQVGERLGQGGRFGFIATNRRLELIGRADHADAAPILWRQALAAAADVLPAPVLLSFFS